MAKSPVRARRFVFERRAGALALCAATLLINGCAERKTRGFPWSTAILVHPRVPPAATPVADDEPLPDLQPAFPDSTKSLIVRSVPPRPRSASGADAGDAGRNSHAEPLSLVPELSPEETAAAQKQTNEGLAIAEGNLNKTRGRTLSPAQADLAAKIRSFIDQAGEAARGGDWTRARNLAQKAQVLSGDLARSL